MEKIISSAIKFKLKNSEYFQVMCGKRHCNIFEMMYNYNIEYNKDSSIQGFFTNKNRFVDRYEGMKIASSNGQLISETNYKELYSEDIFPVEIDEDI